MKRGNNSDCVIKEFFSHRLISMFHKNQNHFFGSLFKTQLEVKSKILLPKLQEHLKTTVA